MPRHHLTATALAALIALAPPLSPVVAIAAPSAVAANPHDAGALSLPAPKAGRARPLVVIVAGNGGAETTDFTLPYAVLKDADVAEVRSLSTKAGPVRLIPALRIITDQTLTQFDADVPAGADIVIIPAQHRPRDPALIAWVRAQATKGATIVAVCEGARVLAHAGLLNGRRATSHWSALAGLDKAYPATTWLRDRRYIQDGPVITTAGVTASIPMALALVEAIGGRNAAQATATRFGMADWSPTHRTADFALRQGDVSGALRAVAAVWTHETVEAPLAAGVDEAALALRADAWSRTFRTRVVITGTGAVRSRHGLTLLPDAPARPGRYLIPGDDGPAAPQLDTAIVQIGLRYGPAAARLSTLGMEYDAVGQRHD